MLLKMKHLPWLLLGNKIKQQHVISLEKKRVFVLFALCFKQRAPI